MDTSERRYPPLHTSTPASFDVQNWFLNLSFMLSAQLTQNKQAATTLMSHICCSLIITVIDNIAEGSFSQE